jgi:hypothetical protein
MSRGSRLSPFGIPRRGETRMADPERQAQSVLAEAGFSPQEVDELRSSGVFGDAK